MESETGNAPLYAFSLLNSSESDWNKLKQNSKKPYVSVAKPSASPKLKTTPDNILPSTKTSNENEWTMLTAVTKSQ